MMANSSFKEKIIKNSSIQICLSAPANMMNLTANWTFVNKVPVWVWIVIIIIVFVCIAITTVQQNGSQEECEITPADQMPYKRKTIQEKLQIKQAGPNLILTFLRNTRREEENIRPPFSVVLHSLAMASWMQ